MALKDAKNDAAGNQDYFDEFAGQGLENFTQDTVSTAYLGMVQPGASASMNHEPGTWRNSSTEENYGKEVEVVVLAFKTTWTERSKEPPYNTVGRYEPNSIEVSIEYPKAGVRGFPKMTNPSTGNKVEELFVYAVVEKEHPENGIMFFSPTVGSMKTCKQWNAQLRSQRLPSGRIAPIFAFSWKLELDLVQNPAKPAEKIAKFVKVTRGELLEKDVFLDKFRPQLEVAAQAQLLAAPEHTGDVEE